MGHEDNGIAQLLAVGMLLMALWHLLQGRGKIINLDSVEIFRVEPIEAAQPIVATVNATVKPAEPEQEPEVKRNHNGYTPFQQDCFESLKALGINGVRERKFIISETFNNHDPTTVQEFLKFALNK